LVIKKLCINFAPNLYQITASKKIIFKGAINSLKLIIMKKIISFFAAIFLFSLTNNVQAQCTPDPGCVDIVNDSCKPGQICPDSLAEGIVGVPYNEVVTIIPPYESDLGQGTVTIVKIEIVGVDNIPPGLTYEANATEMFAYNSYCVLISGTPTSAGVYNLNVRVIPYIDILGTPVAAPEQSDDTSLVITINEPNGINDFSTEEFAFIENIHNPFNTQIQIGFYNNKSEIIKLNVYNILGEMVYKEKMKSVKGKNYFKFTEADIKNGTYIFSITNGKKAFSKQLIKSSN